MHVTQIAWSLAWAGVAGEVPASPHWQGLRGAIAQPLSLARRPRSDSSAQVFIKERPQGWLEDKHLAWDLEVFHDLHKGKNGLGS